MKTNLKTHIGLHVRDVNLSLPFYNAILNQNPVKTKEGYAKYDVTNSNLVLTLIQDQNVEITKFGHFGFLMDSTEEVIDKMNELKSKQLHIRSEMDVNCCYANQDKFWVKDPDGIEWEFYHFNYDIEEKMEKISKEACCEETCCSD